MDLVVTGVVAAVLGTVAMDLLNSLGTRTGTLLKIDVAMIGRMAAGAAVSRCARAGVSLQSSVL